MLKHTLQAPPETGAIDGYTLELSRRLRRTLPGDRIDQIVNEAQTHLYDQADAINVQGTHLTRAEAEARAVAAFIPPAMFAREMSQSAYETRYSKAWHKVGKIVTATMLCGFAVGLVIDGTIVFITSRGYHGTSFAVFSFFALWPVMCLCAFQARCSQTRHLLHWTAIIAVFTFFYTGFFYVLLPLGDGSIEIPNSRLEVQENHDGWHSERLQVAYDIQRLNVGLQTYSQKTPVVPLALQGANGRGYIVPNTVSPGMIFANTRLKNAVYYYPLSTTEMPLIPEIVPTVAQARTRWLKDGPAYLAQAQYEKTVVANNEEPLRIALQQAIFSKSAGWRLASETIHSGLFLLFLDGLFGKLGRVVYAKRRARRERKRAQAY